MEKRKVAVIDCESNSTPAIHKQLRNFNCQVQGISWHSANSIDYTPFDAVFISGSPTLISGGKNKTEQILEKFEFIDELHTPTLGIGFGHHILSLKMGGNIYRSMARRTNDPITVINEYPLFIGLTGESPEFAKDHCEGVELSSQMTLLASSQYYQVEAVMGIKRPFIGVQFHPEESGENGSILIENFLNWADNQ